MKGGKQMSVFYDPKTHTQITDIREFTVRYCKKRMDCCGCPFDFDKEQESCEDWAATNPEQAAKYMGLVISNSSDADTEAKQTVTVFSNTGRKLRSWSGRIQVHSVEDKVIVSDGTKTVATIYGGIIIVEEDKNIK